MRRKDVLKATSLPLPIVIKEVRKAVGDYIKIYVDFNNGYTATRAIMDVNKIYEHFILGVIPIENEMESTQLN